MVDEIDNLAAANYLQNTVESLAAEGGNSLIDIGQQIVKQAGESIIRNVTVLG